METHEAFKINNIDDVQQSRTGNFSIPLQEWFFINIDASFLSYDELTGCGGILRTCNGDWVAGFSCTTGARNIEEGEAWAIYKALQWAWEKKIMNLWIRSDSKDVVDWINKEMNLLGPIGHIICACKAWIRKGWEVKITHAPREFNSVADKLAKDVIIRQCNWIEFNKPPNFILENLESYKRNSLCFLSSVRPRQ
nr:uncharacterized protein LOC109160503 [Ipomoea trifida]